MSASDLERVLEISGSLPEAPDWPASAYLAAMDAESPVRRIALVATAAETDIAAGFLVAGVVAPEAELETIAVAEHAQGLGIGGFLLRFLVEELRREGVSTLNLEVRASNAKALHFYKTQGFREAGRRTRYYADPEEDAVLMALQLG